MFKNTGGVAIQMVWNQNFAQVINMSNIVEIVTLNNAFHLSNKMIKEEFKCVLKIMFYKQNRIIVAN